MSNVTLTIGGRDYTVACAAGEETHVVGLGRLIDGMLDTLPAKQATAIRDTRLAGLSTAEAAARRGISESDVKISVHRGLKALMTRLKGGR